MFVATFRTTAAPHAIMERKGLFVATVLKSLLTACRKEVKAESPLQLTGAYRLERATLAKRVAANHTYHWQQLHENTHNASNNSMHNNSSSTSSSNNSLRPRVPRLA